MARTRSDEVQVGDIVRRAYANGKPYGVPLRVIEVGDKSRQAYWGYWYRDLVTASVLSGRKVHATTADVIVVDRPGTSHADEAIR